jgi:thiosulfate/3-mercaptopyruvate sulfurtransferase
MESTETAAHDKSFRTLISVPELQAIMTRPDVVVLDARFSLDDETWGARAYAEGHIPTAQRADLAEHLAGPIVPGVTGRRPFPAPADFARQLGAWGIDDTTQVVIYDAESGLMAAARAWLMVRWLGHDRVAVLDGGLAAWIDAGGEVTVDDTPRSPRTFVPNIREDLLADVDEVDAQRVLEPTRVFDSRGLEAHHGRGPSHDPVNGHIADTGLADRARTLGPDGRLRSVTDLQDYYRSLIGDLDPGDVIFYCGSGVTAAQNILAMEHAGLTGSRMYVGSWSEWITDPARPIEC